MNSATSNRFRVLAFLVMAGILLCGVGSLFCPMGATMAGAATHVPPAGSHHPMGSGGECPESVTSSPEQIAPFDHVALADVDVSGLTRVLEYAGSHTLVTENNTSCVAPLRFLLLSTFRL